MAVGQRTVRMTCLCLCSIFFGEAAHADPDARTQLIWSQMRLAGVVKVSISCTNSSDNFVGTGFVVDGRYVFTARHLLLDCTKDGSRFGGKYSEDQLTEARRVAAQSTARIRLEFADRTNNISEIRFDDRVFVSDTTDFGYIDLGISSVHRPSLCLSGRLKFEDKQYVTFYGFGGGASGSERSGVVETAETDERLSRSNILGGPGYSGAPVVNENGNVVGVVTNGLNGDGPEYFLPLARLLATLSDLGVLSSLNRQESPIDSNERFAKCTQITLPPIGYRNSTTISVESNWMGGGSDPSAFCRNKTEEKRGSYDATSKFTGSNYREESRKDWLGHVEYHYGCDIKIETGPIYGEGRSQACGLRDPVTDPLSCE